MLTDGNGVAQVTFTNKAAIQTPPDFTKTGLEIKLVMNVQRPGHSCIDSVIFKCVNGDGCVQER